jgi:TolA-binding protein
MAARRRQAEGDGYARQTVTQPGDEARRTARAFLTKYPKEAYASEVEFWRELPDGEIKFTMRRLRSAD